MPDYTEQILHAISICLPVFSLMGLGWCMRAKGLLCTERQNFLNQLVYFLALPALIFSAIADQPVENFLYPGFYAGILLPIFGLTVIYALVGWSFGLRKGRWALFMIGTFWANVSYMGFPLADLAYGTSGLQMAAVYNAVAMPLFVVLGVTLISLVGQEDSSTGLQHIKGIFRNPIILAAGFGLLSVIIRHRFSLDDVAFMRMVGETGQNFFTLLGAMGLPLALIVIGASLEWGAIRGHRVLILSIAVAKLIFLPGLAWFLFAKYFQNVPEVGMQTGVLLSAMPSAVAAYVIGVKMGLEAGLLSALLVITTLLSIITIPLWLIFLSL